MTIKIKYKKYWRKTSLKQEGVGDFFLNEVLIKRPKVFLEVGVFHGVTARNVCELLYTLHGKDFKYIGLDLFEENLESKDEVIPNTKFSNPLKTIYFKFIKRQDPYSKKAVEWERTHASIVYEGISIHKIGKNFRMKHLALH